MRMDVFTIFFGNNVIGVFSTAIACAKCLGRAAALFMSVATAPFAMGEDAGRGLLLISIDGLKPEYVIEATEHGLDIPNLQRMLVEGAYATGVKGVLPTSTFPSHITLITGVAPAKHGIYHNRPFDPPARISGQRWDWLYEHIQVPTIWNAAADAGLKVASVGWPVSLGSGDIHYNIPERVVGSTDEEIWNVVTPGLIDLIGEAAEMRIRAGNVEIANQDWARTCYALEIMRTKEPDLIAVHLAAGDSMQHRYGPFSEQAFAAFEEIDRMVGLLTHAFRTVKPEAVVCITSDHGFSEVTQVLRVDAAFEREGLLSFEPRGRTYGDSEVSDWVALRLPSGGSSPVFLKNPDDDEARERVGRFLENLAANPDHGIASILDREEIARLGGNPNADFWIDMVPGFMISHHLGGSLAASRDRRGTHGYSPTHPEMDSVFIMTGKGIEPGLNLGRIDMRSIAPTMAQALDLALPSAEKPGLEVFGNDER